jgi:hypothetical protein
MADLFHSVQLQSLSAQEQLLTQNQFSNNQRAKGYSEFHKHQQSFGQTESPHQTLSGSKSSQPSKAHKSVHSLNESKESSDSDDV